MMHLGDDWLGSTSYNLNLERLLDLDKRVSLANSMVKASVGIAHCVGEDVAWPSPQDHTGANEPLW